jgi:hypothetical protein
VQEDVRVSFHKTGQERSPREIDDLGARSIDACRWSYGVDAVSAHPHCPAFMRRLTVENATWLENRLARRGQRYEPTEQQKTHGEIVARRYAPLKIFSNR